MTTLKDRALIAWLATRPAFILSDRYGIFVDDLFSRPDAHPDFNRTVDALDFAFATL
jgi:hypothetical protein